MRIHQLQKPSHGVPANVSLDTMSNINNLVGHRIIPVVEIETSGDADPLAEALLAGGISVMEITLRTHSAVAAIQVVSEKYPQIVLGAGTMMTIQQSQQAREAGAQFGVSPALNAEVVDSFKKQGLDFIPGVMTPTEIDAAMGLGCHLLKFFPAESAGGANFLRSISGPFVGQDVSFCATGGITPENMRDYLQLSLVSCIGGSWIASRQLIAEKNWSQITRNAMQANAIVAELDSVS